MKDAEYRYKARDIPAFLSQIVRYIAGGGHYFYIRCLVPKGKNPDEVAEKLIARYGIRKKRWQRKRRYLKNAASIHYLACGRLFVILLSKGQHETFYRDQQEVVQDVRRRALKVFGYSIRYTFSEEEKDWKVFIRLDAEKYRELKTHMLSICTWNSYRDAGRLEREFARLPYQPYGPVYAQILAILKQANKARRRRGWDPICPSCIRKFRRNRRVFLNAPEVFEPGKDHSEAA